MLKDKIEDIRVNNNGVLEKLPRDRSNSDYFDGVLRRVPGTATNRTKGRYTDEFKDIVRLYFLKQSGKDVQKTADFFGEPNSSILTFLKPLLDKQQKSAKASRVSKTSKASNVKFIPTKMDKLMEDIQKLVGTHLENLYKDIRVEVKQEILGKLK